MCAGIDFLRRFYGSNLLARKMEKLTAEKFCFDAENNVYYTPAFRKTGDQIEIDASEELAAITLTEHND